MKHMYRITSLSNAFVDLTNQKHATVSGNIGTNIDMQLIRNQETLIYNL